MSRGRGWGGAYAGYALNGAAAVLLGPLLPRLEGLWRLGDGQGGALLAAQFLGMSLGTIFVARRERRAMELGTACASAGLVALGLLATFGGAARGAMELAFAALAIYGFGLGQAITALNLGTGADGEGRSSRLSFGNAMWSVGAIVAPLLVALALRGKGLGWWLMGLAAVFPAVWLRRFGAERGSDKRLEVRAAAGSTAGLAVVLGFGLAMFLYGSVETCFSGWLTTFARRDGGVGTMASPLGVSAFWLGIAGGRGLAGVALRGWRERDGLLLALSGALAASVGLAWANGMARIAMWAALAGMMLGPVFPLIVSEVLNRRASAREAGLVMAMCGAGGTAMPFVFGVVSQRSSVREAFAVPALCLVGAIAWVAGGLRTPSPPRKRVKYSIDEV